MTAVWWSNDPVWPALSLTRARRDARPVDAGRVIAWIGFLVGSVVSVAANVAHARPAAGPRIAGAVWPCLLLLAVEVLAHNRWPAGRRWAAAGTFLVGAVAAVLSYTHMAGLLARYGEDPVAAHLGPLAVDGLMVVCGAALLAGHTTANARPATTPATPAGPPATQTPDRPAAPVAPAGLGHQPTRPRLVRTPASAPAAGDGAAPDITDLRPAIEEIHTDHGPGLSRDRLLAELRARQLTAGGGRKTAALAYYRSLTDDPTGA